MYITIENEIITGIFCGLKNEGNEIDVPDNFQGRTGQNIKSFYDDWSIKPLSVLIDEGIESIPVGYKLENNLLILMTEIERMKSGIIDIPEGYEILNDRLVEIITPEKQKQRDIMAAQGRLTETDWYAVRFAETGTPIPEEIKTERQALREQISTLRGEAE